jgi:pimeloyl-ACP methyl ester carboxylesterase
MNLIKLSSGIVSYRYYDTRKPNCLVILPALAASCAEWEHLAELWSMDYSVLLYDRHGYGESGRSKNDRSPGNIAEELHELTQLLGIERFIPVGHSFGGICAYMYAYLHPDHVKGLVLLDPVSPLNYKGRDVFTKKEYKKAGFDKASNLIIGRLLCTLRLGWTLLPMLKQAPPFYYYKDFSKQAERMILRNSVSPTTYETAMREYRYIEDKKYQKSLLRKKLLPGIKLQLVLHTPQVMINEIRHYAKVDTAFAGRIEKTWSGIMNWYLKSAKKTKLWTAVKSAHAIHLSDPKTVRAAVDAVGILK